MRGEERRGGGEGGLPSSLFFPLCVTFIPVENDCKKQVQQKANLLLLFQASEMLTLEARTLPPGWFHIGGHIFSLVLLLALASCRREHGIMPVALEGYLAL